MKRRELSRERRQRERLKSRLLWGGGGLLALALLVAGARLVFQPLPGESVPIQGTAHQPEGTIVRVEGDDPPTSGDHYAQSAGRGFYEEPVEDGYLIHSLEHGYIIIWYDCEGLEADVCSTLKADIKQTIDDFPDFKVIGVPREGMRTRIALTSWGRIDRLDWYDSARVVTFVRANHNRAPEPGAS